MNNVDKIVATLVAEEDKINFLPEHFGKAFLRLEMMVYGLARKFCEDHQGGYWDFFHLSNEGGYLGLDTTRRLTLSTPNGFFRPNVNGNTFGIIISLYAINWLSHDLAERGHEAAPLLCDQYERLHDFACQHQDVNLILRAID